MPYVTIPKDLSRIKNKLVFNLTKRQLISFSLAGGNGIPFYLFSRSVIGGDVAAFLMIALMLPFMAFGVYEKDGQPLEKILYHMIRARFLLPRIRVYQTDNLYSALERQAKIDKEVMEIVYHKQKRKIERKK
ncbi:PrgI family protein [Peptoanaerobacter stomatis]|uniref:PrgI family protein n=1 Tax=Peptoanaerobacter stomatis TaxID=796937 RepID=UPI00054DA8F2|nr:PrgI family protein [Peptoanaerobacter stomatis]